MENVMDLVPVPIFVGEIEIEKLFTKEIGVMEKNMDKEPTLGTVRTLFMMANGIKMRWQEEVDVLSQMAIPMKDLGTKASFMDLEFIMLLKQVLKLQENGKIMYWWEERGTTKPRLLRLAFAILQVFIRSKKTPVYPKENQTKTIKRTKLWSHKTKFAQKNRICQFPPKHAQSEPQLLWN